MPQENSTSPWDDSNAIFIPFMSGSAICDLKSAAPLPLEAVRVAEHCKSGAWAVDTVEAMGVWQGRPCYAIELAEGSELDPMSYQATNLYRMLGRFEDQFFAWIGRGSQLLGWRRDHRYCGRCATPLERHGTEPSMQCPSCHYHVFPKISPCIIVLVTRGEELLLARNVGFDRPMYSALAGFIEVGESAEETLVREVREEVAIEVENIQYFSSQAWAFPSQLMLGYFAEYRSGDIVCQQDEIADAQWFHYRELPMVPPSFSIAGSLIESYISRFN